jgi:hypothetical protein
VPVDVVTARELVAAGELPGRAAGDAAGGELRAGADGCRAPDRALPPCPAALFGSISTRPLKVAPSMIPTRGAKMLPRTWAVARTITASLQIALHEALDREVARVHIAEHRAFGPDDEIARVADRALDPPLQDDVLFGGELAAKQQGLAEHRDSGRLDIVCRRRRSGRCGRRSEAPRAARWTIRKTAAFSR